MHSQKEGFGSREEGANVEAGRKGGRISSAERPPEARKEAARKAARTRAKRYGAESRCGATCDRGMTVRSVFNSRAWGWLQSHVP